MGEKKSETDVWRSSAIGVSDPSTKLIEVRPGKLIVARSRDLSTSRNFVFLTHHSSVSAKRKRVDLLERSSRLCKLYMSVAVA